MFVVDGVVVGVCIVAGNLGEGFIATLDNYMLFALADVGDDYVYLFTFFLS